MGKMLEPVTTVTTFWTRFGRGIISSIKLASVVNGMPSQISSSSWITDNVRQSDGSSRDARGRYTLQDPFIFSRLT